MTDTSTDKVISFRTALQRYLRDSGQTMTTEEWNGLTEKDRVELSWMLNEVSGYEHLPHKVNKAKAFFE